VTAFTLFDLEGNAAEKVRSVGGLDELSGARHPILKQAQASEE
jgi:hypothetical protein